MKIGDLVRPHDGGGVFRTSDAAHESWIGIIIGYDNGDPVVMWDENFPDEVEYKEQLEVVNEYESR